MKQIRLVILLVFSIALISTTRAQNKRMSLEEFRNIQKEYFSERAGLDKDEAEKFFPLYFELQDKKYEYNKVVLNKMKEINSGKNVTDTEYSKMIEDIMNTRITIDKLELEYIKKYEKHLSPKKIYLIQRAEIRFRKDFIKSPCKKNE